MSVKIMSMVFEARVPDLEYTDSAGRCKRVKASTAKLVLLAYADHANDDGVAAYPSITRLERKTALTRQGVVNVQKALEQNGFLRYVGVSFRGTNEYVIDLGKLRSLIVEDGDGEEVQNPPQQREPAPRSQEGRGSQPGLPPVNWVDQGSQQGLPGVVNGVDLNHPLTVQQKNKKGTRKSAITALVGFGGLPPEISDDDPAARYKRRVAAALVEGAEAAVRDEVLRFRDWFSEDVWPLAEAFIRAFVPPRNRRDALGWSKPLRDMAAQGVTAEEVMQAVDDMLADGMTIKTPHAVVSRAVTLAVKRKRGVKPNKVKRAGVEERRGKRDLPPMITPAELQERITR